MYIKSTSIYLDCNFINSNSLATQPSPPFCRSHFHLIPTPFLIFSPLVSLSTNDNEIWEPEQLMTLTPSTCS